MSYFWASSWQIPNGIGFPLYHSVHLCWLMAIIISTGCFTWWYRHLQAKTQVWILRIIAFLLLGTELAKDMVLILTGQFRVSSLPLDLCGLSIFLYLSASFLPNRWQMELIYSLSFPGTCFALLFPNWNRLPVWNYLCLHSFFLHALLLLFPVLLLSSGAIRPCARRLPFCFLCIVSACIPIWLFNRRFGTNFFFLARPSKGSPLVWFEQQFGDPAYLIGLPILMGLTWMLLYGVPAVIRRICVKSRLPHSSKKSAGK